MRRRTGASRFPGRRAADPSLLRLRRTSTALDSAAAGAEGHASVCIKPYRREAEMEKIQGFPGISNLLLAVMPAYANHIWAADFTELVQHGKKVYVATVIDLYTAGSWESMLR